MKQHLNEKAEKYKATYSLRSTKESENDDSMFVSKPMKLEYIIYAPQEEINKNHSVKT